MQHTANTTPLVSCITIFHNPVISFFTGAIDSIIGQTYTNWELFLVDDGSANKSSEIARKYAESCPNRITCLEHAGHQNRGMSASRNLGIENSRGKYVAFLDSDDIWLTNKLEEQVAILETYPDVNMVFGRTLIWIGWTGKRRHELRDHMLDTSPVYDNPIAGETVLKAYLNHQGRTFYPCTCSSIYRASIFRKIGNFVDEFRNANEDMAFNSKVFLAGEVFASSSSWDKYRIHRNSYWQSTMTNSGSGVKQREGLKLLDWLDSYIETSGIGNKSIQDLVRSTRVIYKHPVRHAWLDFLKSPCKNHKQVAALMIPDSIYQWLRHR